jgi:hypothetical protein
VLAANESAKQRVIDQFEIVVAEGRLIKRNCHQIRHAQSMTYPTLNMMLK